MKIKLGVFFGGKSVEHEIAVKMCIRDSNMSNIFLVE